MIDKATLLLSKELTENKKNSHFANFMFKFWTYKTWSCIWSVDSKNKNVYLCDVFNQSKYAFHCIYSLYIIFVFSTVMAYFHKIQLYWYICAQHSHMILNMEKDRTVLSSLPIWWSLGIIYKTEFFYIKNDRDSGFTLPIYMKRFCCLIITIKEER